MNQRLILLLTLMLAAFHTCATAQSAIISIDFHQLGDGLLTYDTVNQREWLDLSETSGWSLTATKHALAPGGQFHDFHIATVSDVSALTRSAGYDGTSNSGDPNFTVATALVDLLHQGVKSTQTLISVGNTRFPGGDIQITIRYANAWAASDTINGAFEDFAVYTIAPTVSFAGPQGDNANSDVLQYRSVWLYRDAVFPEPPSAMLLIFAVCAITTLQRCDFVELYRGAHER